MKPMTSIPLQVSAISLAFACLGVAAGSESPKQGAALLKTDILGVFAHPDDETGMAATLARYALGEGKAVVNVYCTRGEGGGNMAGTQWGASLGVLRETELRECLATLGVRSCYFLDRLDWAYTESAAATLRKWDKEETLERLVRLVRALRPEIIVTMNPAPTPGQHGHHQAAGVLATEAFTAAADSNRFPLQLAREGLTIWQVRKLFFAGSNGQTVANIALTEPLPNGETPGQVAARALVNHRSQAFGNFANSPFMKRPQRFTLVKSFVPIAGTETNLLAGLPVPDASLAPIQFAKAPAEPVLDLGFIPRPAFANYRRWVKEQGIENVAAQFRADLPVVAGEANLVRLQIHNNAPVAVEGELNVEVPAGWIVGPAQRRVQAASGANPSFELHVTPPEGQRADADLMATFITDGQTARAEAKLHPVPRAHVPRLRTAPALDGTDRGWENVRLLAITPTNLVEGRVSSEADSSALLRVAHDSTTLFVDVIVRDDAVITNIAPNDIRGHWRSDSVEICLDPTAGAEDTLGCYKLGIFPFDTTGVVRAARDADANQGPMEETAPRTRLVSRRTSDGYRIQGAIPFAEIGLPPGKKRLGFNVIVYDGDKPNAAIGENINKSRIAWAPRPGVQGRPEDWGRLDLE